MGSQSVEMAIPYEMGSRGMQTDIERRHKYHTSQAANTTRDAEHQRESAPKTPKLPCFRERSVGHHVGLHIGRARDVSTGTLHRSNVVHIRLLPTPMLHI